jgi:diacylglycerol kinase (ATP)
MNVLLVHNAEAGTADTPEQQHVVAEIRTAGHTVTSVSTKDNWRAAIMPHHDLVVAAGGDGTVRRVASALVGQPTPMAILPMGTANNIATSFGLAGLETAQVIERW